MKEKIITFFMSILAILLFNGMWMLWIYVAILEPVHEKQVDVNLTIETLEVAPVVQPTVIQ